MADIDVSAITAKVEADDASGRFKETDQVDLKDSGRDDGDELDLDVEAAGDQPGGEAPAAPAAPKFNPLNLGGKAWSPDEFLKDPSKWDEFGGNLKRWESDYTRKRQREAAEMQRVQQQQQAIEAQYQQLRAEYDRFGDPTYGPALLLQTLKDRYGYHIPEQLQRQILLDPVRQLRMEMDQREQKLQTQLQQRLEAQEQEKRLAQIDQQWSATRQTLGLPEKSHERLFDLWASYQIGDQPMDPSQATEQVGLLIADLLDPKAWSAIPEKYRQPIEMEIVRAYVAKKKAAMQTTPLTSSGAPPATAIGQQRGSRKLPSEVGGFDKYTESLVNRASGR